MSPTLRSAFHNELQAGRLRRAAGDLDAAFKHFERAHILGQRDTLAHVRAHALMLGVGWERRDSRELVAQLVRIVAALMFSRLWVPVGNTGGANVSAFRAMDVPDDLASILREASAETTRSNPPPI
jgi:hypothetical protein